MNGDTPSTEWSRTRWPSRWHPNLAARLDDRIADLIALQAVDQPKPAPLGPAARQAPEERTDCRRCC